MIIRLAYAHTTNKKCFTRQHLRHFKRFDIETEKKSFFIRFFSGKV